MHITTQNIIQNSDTIFSILNQNQKKQVRLLEKIAKLGIETKIRVDKENSRGQLIDILV